MTYDVIIIGSGIAGLYAAYKIKQSSPETNYLILEKNPKRNIGGRANNEQFYGTSIVTGAGIGRKKDKLLKTLLTELGFEINEFKSVTAYLSIPVSMTNGSREGNLSIPVSTTRGSREGN